MLVALLLAAAAAAPAKDARPPVALLPLRGLGVAPASLQALEGMLRNELAALPETRLLPESALQQALAREEDCAERVSCAAAAAHKAGAQVLVLATASQLGDSYLVDLKLVDAKSGEERRRVQHPLSGEMALLIDALGAAAVELLAPARYSGSIRLELPGADGAEVFIDGKPVGMAPLEKPIAGLVPGQHTVKVASSGHVERSAFVDVRYNRVTPARLEVSSRAPLLAGVRQPWMKVAGYSGVGLAAVSGLTGLFLHAKAYATAADLNKRESQNQLSGSDASAYGAVDRNVHNARSLYLTAAIAGGLGLGLVLWDRHLDDVALRAQLAASPGGLSLTGSF